MALRHAFALVGFVLLLTFAYSPLLQAGLLAPDMARLIDGTRAPDTSILAGQSLALSAALHGVAPDSGAWLRAENLLLYVVSALGLGLFTRRLLLPWCGSEPARAAAGCTALFFALHPLGTPAVASLASRGDLLALAFGTWSAALFLRGRQDRHYPLTGLALLLCLLAGACSQIALGLPFVLAVAELASAHRYRPLRVRVRTAATTLVVFALAASVETILDGISTGRAALPPSALALLDIDSWSDLGDSLILGIEKLGLLVLPANPLALGIAGTLLSGAIFLLAMQPRAGRRPHRSAPVGLAPVRVAGGPGRLGAPARARSRVRRRVLERAHAAAVGGGALDRPRPRSDGALGLGAPLRGLGRRPRAGLHRPRQRASLARRLARGDGTAARPARGLRALRRGAAPGARPSRPGARDRPAGRRAAAAARRRPRRARRRDRDRRPVDRRLPGPARRARGRHAAVPAHDRPDLGPGLRRRGRAPRAAARPARGLGAGPAVAGVAQVASARPRAAADHDPAGDRLEPGGGARSARGVLARLRRRAHPSSTAGIAASGCRPAPSRSACSTWAVR